MQFCLIALEEVESAWDAPKFHPRFTPCPANVLGFVSLVKELKKEQP